jgi:hypothetical protein
MKLTLHVMHCEDTKMLRLQHMHTRLSGTIINSSLKQLSQRASMDDHTTNTYHTQSTRSSSQWKQTNSEGPDSLDSKQGVPSQQLMAANLVETQQLR